MTTRLLGASQIPVSTVGLGCNNFSRPTSATADQESSTRVILAAIEAGVTFFDTAELYGIEPGVAEIFMGNALRGRRDEVVLASKWGFENRCGPGLEDAGPAGQERYIRSAVEGSLRRLQTDYLDLYQLHSPDPHTPIAETLGVLADLVQEGKVREVGHSNFSAAQIREAESASGKARFTTAQNEYSLLHREVELDVLPAARQAGATFIPFFPLANGLLTGKYTRGGGEGRLTRSKPHLLADVDWEQLARFQELCDELGAPMVRVALAWLAAQDGVLSVIAGATSPEQVEDNAAAADLTLEPDTLRRISALFAR